MQGKELYDYKVKKTESEDLTHANYEYFRILKEMNSELIRGLENSLMVSLKREVNTMFELVVDRYKGKLIESLLEINFIEAFEEIKAEVEENPYAEKPETTYLYVIEGKDSQKIKIGISKNIDSRLAHLQTSNPEELEVLNKMEFDYRSEALDAESLLHEYFSDYRIMPKGKSTEWFKPDIKKYVYGLGKEHLPQIEKIIEARHQKMVEAVNAVKFEY